ncbi:hypothetical protein GCM10009551_051130 [Nocardiopsis tropica]
MAVEGEVVPSGAGGSSTPFLMPPGVVGGATSKGLFLVLLSVRCAVVHMRQQDYAYRYLPH